MRAVVQRVSQADVTVDGARVAAIDEGMLVYLGVAAGDDEKDAAYLAEKTCHLRVFPDAEGRLNLDVLQAGGKALVVSAFTVQADARKGRRPTLEGAAAPEPAAELYERFCRALRELGLAVEQGRFRATMNVRSVNAGPVCMLLDSKKTF